MQGTLGFSATTRFCTFRSDRRTVVSAAYVAAPATRTSARSPYEVLRVNKDASLKEIKAAYRRLAKLYHPDVSAAPAAAAAAAMAGREFIEIHEAYLKLSDPVARAESDAPFGYTSYRYQSSQDSVWPESEYCSGRRWETDQCW